MKADFELAAELYRLAAEQGHADAQYALGAMTENGRGVKANLKRALYYYNLAAEQGHVNAQVNLGVVYVKGETDIQDFVKAHMWFNLAAAQGNKTARDFRDRIAKQMMPSDISFAQKQARICLEQNYQKCS